MIKIEFLDGRQPLEIDAETISAAVQYAVENRLSLSWVNLHEADLSLADLRGADLSWAYLRWADLRGADLREADLREADLSFADLRGADLRGADVDFSCWPLWCGSLNVKIDKPIFCQLIYHTLLAGQSVDDQEVKKLFEIPEVVNLANKFHRVDECGKIELKVENNGK